MLKTLNHHKFAILSALTLVFSGFSYMVFLNYAPKSLKELSEVKGIKDSTEFKIPYPIDATELGYTKKNNGYEVTLVSAKSPSDVQKFYGNIFEFKEWELESQEITADSITTEYKVKDQRALINASSYEDGKSLITIHVTHR